MNAARMGVLVLAIVAAGLAALLARGLVSSGDVPAETKIIEAPQAEVLVASTNIGRGERLSSSSLRWQNWPEASLVPGYITRAQAPEAISEMTGNLARTSLSNGEPITETKVVNSKTGGFMAALIAPGKRAVAITVSPETGAGGFILPNDHVDIIHTRRVTQDTSRGLQDVIQGEVLLRDIRVLAIDQRFKDDSGDQVALGKTATLELTAAQAERVTVAQAEGALILSLRGLSEAADHQNDEVIVQPESSSIAVVRGGTQQIIRVR